MLRKYSQHRSLNDNLKLGVLTAFVAGMVNVSSLLIFFSFTSNVTGYYAILASEIVKGNFYQVLIVLSWIFLFFFGGFISNLIVISLNNRNTYLAHSLPIVLEILCLIFVGVYGDFFYEETLRETEILVAIMLFAMGLQNGLTASISNFSVKTTHLTGATTDLGILFSMFTKKEFRKNKGIIDRAKLIFSIFISYVVGAIVASYYFNIIQFKIFYIVCFVLVIVLVYDFSKIRYFKFLIRVTARRKAKVNSGLVENNVDVL
jgi:uncharacterized membrane protein YoaK (UPF0700 family)